jgi:hypothetical protein
MDETSFDRWTVALMRRFSTPRTRRYALVSLVGGTATLVG